MKKILSLCIASALLASISAFAAIGGKWHGTGNVTMTGMQPMSCETVVADIEEDASSLELRQFDYNCSGMEVKSSPIRLDQRAGSYYLGGQKVGHTDGSVSEFTLVDTAANATMVFRFERVGANLKVTNSMTANGFNQVLEANLQQ
jgi:hypothetical protein